MEYYLWLTGYFAAIVVIFYIFLRFILSTNCSVNQQALRGRHVLVTLKKNLIIAKPEYSELIRYNGKSVKCGRNVRPLKKTSRKTCVVVVCEMKRKYYVKKGVEKLLQCGMCTSFNLEFTRSFKNSRLNLMYTNPFIPIHKSLIRGSSLCIPYRSAKMKEFCLPDAVSNQKTVPLESLSKHIFNATVVTGGSSGIGKCVAIEAAKLGADVTLIARDLDKLKAAVAEVQKNSNQINQRIRSISLDLSANYEHIEEILNELENSAGPVHLLINCAGMAICGVLEDLSVKDIQHLINLNFLGTVHTIKALLPKMKARHEGHIVITASQAALLGIYGLSIYSSTKFALRGLAESLHMEVKPFGIAVTLAMPPDTDTPGFENEEKSKPMATRVISQLGGLYQPETVAKQIIKDTLAGNFFSCVGFDSKVTSILCSGWSPPNSVLDVLLQSSTMGLLRIVSVFYHWYFGSVVRKYLHSHSRKKLLEETNASSKAVTVDQKF